MRYVKATPLEVGYRVWQLRPPQPSISIAVKGTFDPVAGDVAADTLLYVPAGHCVHAARERAPADTLYVPSGHGLHADTSVAPTAALNVPAGHSAHVAADDAPEAPL